MDRGPETASWKEVRELLVFHEEGRMDEALRLARESGRLEKAARLDCASQARAGCGNSRRIRARGGENFPRCLSTVPVHVIARMEIVKGKEQMQWL